MCGGGGGVPGPPPPSATEETLNQEYLSLLQQGRRDSDALRPLIAEESGYRPIYGDDPEQVALFKKLETIRRERGGGTGEGYNDAETNDIVKKLTSLGYNGGDKVTQKIIGYEPTEELKSSQARARGLQARVDAATDQMLDLQGMRAERQKKALAGELPISEGTTQRKKQEFDLLKENLARAGNPIIGDDPATAYSLTTAGSQSLGEFNKRFGLLEDAERRGEIDSGTAALSSGLGLTSDIGSRRYGQSSSTGSGLNANLMGSSSTLLPAYLQGQQPYQQQRGMEYQGQIQSSINRQQERAGYLNLIGTAGGSAAGAAMMMSSRTFKKNIKKVGRKGERKALELIKKGDIYEYDYKHEPTEKRRQHIGLITEESPRELVSKDGKHLDVVNYFGTLTGAVRELSRKMDSLSSRRA